jgi:hypothetical protein
MSARKLGRIVGLVFVLALTFGGVSVAWGSDRESGTGDPAIVVHNPRPPVQRPGNIDINKDFNWD